jgi:hypothetical protein
MKLQGFAVYSNPSYPDTSDCSDVSGYEKYPLVRSFGYRITQTDFVPVHSPEILLHF